MPYEMLEAMTEPLPYSIRRATLADAAGILDCLRLAFEPFRTQYSPQGFRDTVLSPETLPARMAAMTVFVAAGDTGKVFGTIGCAALQHGEGHIRGMAVLPPFQGAPIAPRLLAAAEQELRRRGCNRASLDTTAPLQRAIRFYEKHGYRASGKVGDFFGMPLYEYVKSL